jgi:ketosteroid isomerase-like protein
MVTTMLFTSCGMREKRPSHEMMEAWKKEISDTEATFAQMAKEEGMNKAFLAFAADDAVLMRGNELIESKAAIAEYMKGQNSKGLAWSPEFVDVAKSGDMGYTYGYYTFNYEDQEGNPAEARGVFHTVWKRQEDGSWKFVWD